jgi:uncharacterized protein (TIGR00290 family)
MLEGHEVNYLFTMFDTTGKQTRSHRLSKKLLFAQAEAMGISVYHRRASWNTYEGEFKKALAFFKQKGVEGGIFGDLHVNEHREWLKRVCAQPGVIPLLPLWGIAGKDLLGQFIEAGFEAVVIAVKDGLLGTEWLGRRIDQQFMNEMEKEASDICGENGEYHTLIVDGPVFKKKIAIRDTRLVTSKDVSFLEIIDFELKKK